MELRNGLRELIAFAETLAIGDWRFGPSKVGTRSRGVLDFFLMGGREPGVADPSKSTKNKKNKNRQPHLPQRP